jgi:Exostosin family
VALVYVDTIRRPRANNAAAIVEKHDRMFRALAGRSQQHLLCSDPRDAEIILLYDPVPLHAWTGDYLQRDVLAHPLFTQHPERAFVYDISDFPVPRARGIYASPDVTWYDASRHRAGPYLHYLFDELAARVAPTEPPELLYSFVGDLTTHPLRARLAALSHPSGLIANTANRPPWKGGDQRSYVEEYAAVMNRSRFVLCPRGRGVASMRLFETMRLGRAPVIISDWWVPIPGPLWQTFSVPVREMDVSNIPSMLERLTKKAPEMGRRARSAWEHWFAPDVLFDRLINWCFEIRSGPRRRRVCCSHKPFGMALALLEAVPRTNRLAQTIKRRLI